MRKDTLYYKRIYPLLFMLLITVVCISITSGLYLSTQQRVIANETLFLKKTILEAADVEYPDNFQEITTIYNNTVVEESGYYTVATGVEAVYVMPFTGPGLWGPIELMVGFRDDLDALTGIGIVSQNETPGLGARIEEEWFKKQFAGKWGPFTLVEEGTATRTDQIDSITGATRTSRSIQAILNKAVSEGPALVQAKGE